MVTMERTFLVPCECSATVPATAGQAGEQLVCAACGRGVVVPRFRDLARLEVAREHVAAVPGWDLGRGLVLVGGTIALVAAALALNMDRIGARFFTRPPDTDGIRSAVHAASAVDVHAAWRVLATAGVRRPPTEEEVRLQQFTRSARGFASALWAAAGIAAAVAVAGGLLTATRRPPPAGSA